MAQAPLLVLPDAPPMNEDERLDDAIAAQHKREKLWSDEDARLAEQAMNREDAA